MAKYKKSASEVKHEVSQLKQEIEILRVQSRESGLAFSSLNEDELVRKVKGETSNSPFIFGQSWTSGTTPGSAASYTVHVRNPDPVGYFPFYATVFFGLGNFFNTGLAWSGRDERWPALSSTRTSLAANSNHSFNFAYTTPTGLPLGTYNGNSVIWHGSWHDIGSEYDRGSFDVRLQ